MGGVGVICRVCQRPAGTNDECAECVKYRAPVQFADFDAAAITPAQIRQAVIRDPSMHAAYTVGAQDAMMTAIEREKATRIKYQDITYDACIALDQALDRSVKHGKGTRADEIVAAIRTLEAQRDAWKAYAYHLESCRECAASDVSCRLTSAPATRRLARKSPRSETMLTVSNLDEAEGQWVNDYVRLLTAPKLTDGRYTALAQVGDALAFVELRVTTHSRAAARGEPGGER